MTREEEIRQEMSKIAGAHPDWTKNDCMRMGFYEGAKWADNHPKEGLVSIDKVCAYLEMRIDDYIIRDLRKAMEL